MIYVACSCIVACPGTIAAHSCEDFVPRAASTAHCARPFRRPVTWGKQSPGDKPR